MNRQITHCSFNVVSFDGTNTNVINGFPVNVNVSAGTYSYRPYYHTGSAYDEAITGTLRSQLGGYRFEATLMWDRLINSAPLLQVINNAFSKDAKQITIQFFPDATNTSISENVVIEDVVWDASLDGTIVRQPLSIRLRGKQVKDSISSYFRI